MKAMRLGACNKFWVNEGSQGTKLLRKSAFFCVLLCVLTARPLAACAQADELAQLALNIEKLAQFKQILTDLKKGYQILAGGYNSIKSISKGNYQLHENFLNGLMEINPAVKSYVKVGQIIALQKQLVRNYKSAQQRFKNDSRLTAQELNHISAVYKNVIEGSLKSLDDLLSVLTAGKLRMSDDERILAIDRIYEDMQDKQVFVATFNNSSSILSLQRFKDAEELRRLKTYYQGE